MNPFSGIYTKASSPIIPAIVIAIHKNKKDLPLDVFSFFSIFPSLLAGAYEFAEKLINLHFCDGYSLLIACANSSCLTRNFGYSLCPTKHNELPCSINSIAPQNESNPPEKSDTAL